MEDGQNSLDASAVATALRRGSVPEGLAAKRGYGRGLVVLYVEHGVEFCNLQQVLNSFSQMQQLQLAALVADGCESGDQFAYARAVNVVHLAQVQQDLLLPFCQQFLDAVAQHRAAFALERPDGLATGHHVGPHAARSHQRRVRLGPPKLPRRACPPSETMWKLSWHFPLGHCNIISKQTSRTLPPNLHAPFPHQPSRPATSLD